MHMQQTWSPRLLVTDLRTASRRAADVIAVELRTDAPCLGLATGSSVDTVFRHLAELVASDEVLRAGVARAHAFALDEYVGLPRGDPRSYSDTLRRQLADPIGLEPSRLHTPIALPDEDPSPYDEAIQTAGGIGVQLLGIGANGHIGFNEPGSPVDSRTRVVRLADRTRSDNARFFPSPDDVPTHAVTQGIGTILSARRLVVLAFGPGKAAALQAAVHGPLTEDVPASALRLHPDVVILADRDAASGLSLPPRPDATYA